LGSTSCTKMDSGRAVNSYESTAHSKRRRKKFASWVAQGFEWQFAY
jgi:hypothetical protein